MIKESGGIAAKDSEGCIESFDCGESFGGIIEESGASRVSGEDGREGADREVQVVGHHVCGQSPGAIQQQQTAVAIGF
jgi:hypothetical protein